ncbi:GTP pyrophosphokinase family protein, partial [Burkholderia multivorans]
GELDGRREQLHAEFHAVDSPGEENDSDGELLRLLLRLTRAEG